MIAATSIWLTIEPIFAVATVLAAVATIIATRGIQKARIDGLEGALGVATTNVASLGEALKIQHDKHEEDRTRDREDCDRQIAVLRDEVRRARSEAAAASSDVVAKVTKATTDALLAFATQASDGIAKGQGEIIGRLQEIKTAITEGAK